MPSLRFEPLPEGPQRDQIQDAVAKQFGKLLHKHGTKGIWQERLYPLTINDVMGRARVRLSIEIEQAAEIIPDAQG